MQVIATSDRALAAPVFDATGRLFAVCPTTGSIVTVSEETGVEVFLEGAGSPSGISFDANNDAYVCDQERRGVYKVERDAATGAPVLQSFVAQFEGRALVGPQRVRFTPNGELLFTDGGALGETSFGQANGAVYRTVQRRQQLLRLSGGLANPTGLAVDPRNGIIYVAETVQNRVLRFVPRPEGYYLGSAWATLRGSLGPVDIAVSPVNGDVFIAKYDVPEASSCGSVVVLDAAGDEKGHIMTPEAEVTGVAVTSSGEWLIITTVTPQGTSNVYRTPAP